MDINFSLKNHVNPGLEQSGAPSVWEERCWMTQPLAEFVINDEQLLSRVLRPL